MEDSYILGIKRNGVSLKIDTLTFEADQSGYEYISNIIEFQDLEETVNII